MIEILYYLSQLFLLIGAATTVGVVHLTSQMTPRPPWYYHIAVWVTGMVCAWVFSQPYIHSIRYDMTPAQYCFRIAFGVEHLAVWVYYRYKTGIQLSPHAIRTTNRLVSAGAFLLIIAAFGMGLFNGILKNREETKSLRREVKESVMAVVPQKLQAVEQTIKILRMELIESDSIILGLTKELARTRSQLAVVTTQLVALGKMTVELEQVIRNLDRKTNFNQRGVYPIPKVDRATPGLNAVPADRVIIPEPKKETNKERRKRLRAESSSFAPIRDSPLLATPTENEQP